MTENSNQDPKLVFTQILSLRLGGGSSTLYGANMDLFLMDLVNTTTSSNTKEKPEQILAKVKSTSGFSGLNRLTDVTDEFTLSLINEVRSTLGPKG